MSLIAKFRWFLAPSIFQASVAFATLPLATLILDAADYGAYAVVAAITALASAAACLGSSYLLAHVFSEGETEKIKEFVSQQSAISLGLAIFLACLLIAVWPAMVSCFPNLALIPTMGFVLSALAIVPTTLWAVSVDVLTLDGRAKVFALVTIGQSISSASALLVCLFGFHLDALSLYVSAAMGALVVGAGAFVCLRPYLLPPRLGAGLSVFRHALSLTSANLLEIAYQAWERSLLAASDGLASLGIYAHAQQYRSIIGVATKALSRSIWPATLKEASQEPLTFQLTSRSWRLTHLLLGLVGMGFAIFGDVLIGWITHGKFVGAGPYAAIGVAHLLIQNSGRPHIGFLYARGEVQIYAKLNIAAVVISFIVAAVAIPLWGPWGALLATLLQHGLLRTAIQLYVARKAAVPFQDELALLGVILIAAATYMSMAFSLGLFSQSVLWLLSAAALFGGYVAIGRNRRGHHRAIAWRKLFGRNVP
jgi:O-antigen/teichoic acid export membrane protein